MACDLNGLEGDEDEQKEEEDEREKEDTTNRPIPIQHDSIQTQRDSTPQIDPPPLSRAPQLSITPLLKSQDHRMEEAVQKKRRELSSIHDQQGHTVRRES